MFSEVKNISKRIWWKIRLLYYVMRKRHYANRVSEHTYYQRRLNEFSRKEIAAENQYKEEINK